MSALGLTRCEREKYSFLRAVRSLLAGDREVARYEREISDTLCRDWNAPLTTSNSIRVPAEVLTRDLTAASGAGGGYLVDTENVGFLDLLRPNSVVLSSGAQRLPGLRGNVTLPKATADPSFTWLSSESTPAAESQPTFAQIAVAPKTVAGVVPISRQLLLQSAPAADRLVRAALAKGAATALDIAALNGSGASGQPLGILNTAGIGSVSGTSIDYAKVIEFQTDVATANGLAPSCTYITTPGVAGVLKQRYRVANTDTPLWRGSLLEGEVEGFPGRTTNNMPAATLLFGDWSQIYVAEFGPGIELAFNPFHNFPSGVVAVRVMYSVDIAVAQPGAFSRAVSIT